MKLKTGVILSGILILGAFLRFYQLSNFMQFGGDEGWGYLVARDAILSKKLPILGPPTSLDWFRLGPLPYDILILSVYLGKFHPLSFGITTALLDIGGIAIMYGIGKTISDKKTGLISSMVYAVSPFLIIHSRIPLYVNLVPFFSCLFYLFWFMFISKFKKHKRNYKYFYLSCFAFGLLVQMHVTPILLIPVFLITVAGKMSIKSLLAGTGSFIFPLIPHLYSEVTLHFEMTKKIFLWFPYRMLSAVGIFTEKNIMTSDRFAQAKSIYVVTLVDSVFPQIPFLAILLLFFSIVFLYMHFRNSFVMGVAGSIFLATMGVFIHGQPAEHYLLYIIPLVILCVSIFSSKVKWGFIILTALVIVNSYYFLSTKLSEGLPLSERIQAMKMIMQDAKSADYAINPTPDIVGLTHYYDGYRYLGYWLGKEPSETSQNTYFIFQRKGIEGIFPGASKIGDFKHLTILKI